MYVEGVSSEEGFGSRSVEGESMRAKAKKRKTYGGIEVFGEFGYGAWLSNPSTMISILANSHSHSHSKRGPPPGGITLSAVRVHVLPPIFLRYRIKQNPIHSSFLYI